MLSGLLLTSAMVASGAGFSHVQPPKAPTNTSVIRTITQNKAVNKIVNEQQAINLIQNKYLSQNENGTFTINSNASKEISANTLNKIQESVNFTNENILNGNLQFKLTKANGKTIVTTIKVSNKYKELMSQKMMNSLKQSSGNNFAVELSNSWINNNMYGVVNHWWGGYGYVDSGSVYSFYEMCEANGNTDWANTALTAYENNYTLTVTFSNVFGVTGVSY